MKRKPLLSAIALLLVLGAALLGVNWRLNNPPLSDADRKFRALVAGADSVQMSQESCQLKPACLKNNWVTYDPIDAAQTRELVRTIRIVGSETVPIGAQWKSYARLNLSFKRRGKEVAYLAILQDKKSSLLATPSKPFQLSTGGVWQNFVSPTYRIHPRSERPLRQFLDQIAPQRIQP